jgi:ribose transport system substrate-binding protein
MLAAVTALALTLSGCSDDGDSGGSGNGASTTQDAGSLAKAKKAIEAAEAAPQMTLPSEALDVSDLQGKTVYLIVGDLSNAFVAELAKYINEASDLIGFNVTTLNSHESAAQQTAFIRQAVSNHVAGILTIGVSSTQAPAAMKEAQAAGIPVVTTVVQSVGEDLQPDISAIVGPDTYKVGQVQADYAYVDSPGDVHAVAYGSTILSQDVRQWDGQKAELEKLCGDSCSISTENIDLTKFQTDLPLNVRAKVTSDPSINWLLPDWDVLATYVYAGLKQASATDRVKFSSWNGIPSAVDMVRSGEEAATVGISLHIWGYAAADTIGRLMAGQSTPSSVELPTRLVTKDLLDELGSDATEDEIYASSTLLDGYKKLWNAS